MASKQRGTVKWFNDRKGYGFITPEAGGKDIFIHYTNITGEGYRSLAEGQVVEYDVSEGAKGAHAVDVAKV